MQYLGMSFRRIGDHVVVGVDRHCKGGSGRAAAGLKIQVGLGDVGVGVRLERK